jgi:hypothetical protein
MHAGVPFLVVAHCYGVRPTLAVCRDHPDASAGIVVPAYSRREQGPVALRRRMRRRIGLMRRAPVRVAYQLRYGPARLAPDVFAGDETTPQEWLSELARLVPLWLLMGEHDTSRLDLERRLPDLMAAGDVSYEVVEGLVLRATPTPMAQTVFRERVAAWARERVLAASAP